MHLWLEDLTILTVLLTFHSEEKCIQFFTDMGLLPRADRNMVPNCPKCSCPMKVHADGTCKPAFVWHCRKFRQEPGKRLSSCFRISLTANTLFYNMRLSYQDMLILIYCFVVKQPVNSVLSEMSRTRRFFNKRSVSSYIIRGTSDLFCHICNVHASRFTGCLGGIGERLKLEDLFLTNLSVKSHLFSSHLVLGIYCANKMEGVFVEVDEDLNLDILSVIREYCHPETLIVPLGCMLKSKDCNESIITEFVCRDLSDDSFVEKIDIELLKTHLKDSFPFKVNDCQRDMSKTLYWRVRLNYKTVPEKMQTFLLDIQMVFPGIFSEGLKMKSY